MRDPTSYSNALTIRWDGKGVPYGGDGTPRPDGHANYGFKRLKGDPELLSSVPELTDDPALFALIEAINQTSTGLFSVGCASGDSADERGHFSTGYVEFALNSVGAVQSAASYFPAFFHFGRFLNETGFSQSAQFTWELQPVTFVDVNVSGFTVTIWISTGLTLTPADALTIWDGALGALTAFLPSIKAQPGQAIY